MTTLPDTRDVEGRGIGGGGHTRQLITHQQWLVSAAGNVFVRLAGLVAAIILARNLGPSGRGVVTEAMLWPTVVLSCAAIMNVQTSTFFSSRDLARGLRACLIVAAVAAALLLPVMLLVNRIALGSGAKNSFTAANVYAVAAMLTLVTNAFGGALLGRDRVGEFWFSRALPGLLTAMAAIALGALGMLTPLSFVSFATAGSVLDLLWMVWRQRDLGGRVAGDGALPLRKVLLYGSTTAAVMLPYQLNLRLDQLLLSVLSTEHALGLYAVANAWSSMLSMVGSGFSLVVMTQSARVLDRDSVATSPLFRKVRLAILLVAIMGCVTAVVAPFGVPMLYGSNFSGAVSSALVLCVASIPLYVNVVLHDFARGLGYPEVGIRPELAGLACNVVMLLILIPRYGPMGAAISSLVSYSIVCALMLFVLGRRVPSSSISMLIPGKADLVSLATSLRRVVSDASVLVRR